MASTTLPVEVKKLSPRDRLILAGLIGLVILVLAIYIPKLGGYLGDFKNILAPTRVWLAGEDVYLPFRLKLDPLQVPYPFTAYLLVVPFALLPNWLATCLFSALGGALLSWLILRKGEIWYLLLFLSWPYVNNLFFSQFSAYAASMFFTPGLLLFVLFKPQLTLPFAMIQKPNRIGLLLSGILLIVSLVLYPTWIWEWLKLLQMKNYIGFSPLLFLPLGPLLLLALIRYRDKRAWLLVLLAAMPQRMVYDQLGVLLVAENRKQLIFLVLCSWLSLPLLFYYQGWENVPLGWQYWVLIESYLPALVVVLLPNMKDSIRAARARLKI